MCERLKKYIYAERQIGVSQAARELGENKETVRTWVTGSAVPRPDKMTRIFEWSGGAVQPNDFYPLPAEDACCNRHDRPDTEQTAEAAA